MSKLTIFFVMLLYTTRTSTMLLKYKNTQLNHNERNLNLEKVFEIFNDKALNEKRLREYARDNKQEELKTVLKEPDVNVNAKDPFTLISALHIAVDNDHLEIGKILLQEKNIDINSQDFEGSTPLHLAMSHGNAKYTLLLLENKAKTNIANKYGEFPHHYIYPTQRGGTPPKTPSKKALSFDTKAHSCLLYSELIPIHDAEKQDERVKWNLLHSVLLHERLAHLYYQQQNNRLNS